MPLKQNGHGRGNTHGVLESTLHAWMPHLQGHSRSYSWWKNTSVPLEAREYSWPISRGSWKERDSKRPFAAEGFTCLCSRKVVIYSGKYLDDRGTWVHQGGVRVELWYSGIILSGSNLLCFNFRSRAQPWNFYTYGNDFLIKYWYMSMSSREPAKGISSYLVPMFRPGS